MPGKQLRAALGAALLSAVLVVLAPATQAREAADPAPIIAAAGDISCDPASPAYNGGLGTSTDCRQAHTADLLAGAAAVLPLGDNQYGCGGLAAYEEAYDPTWGRFKAVTHPVPGNHEYQTTGGTDCGAGAAGYFTYFGQAAGVPGQGYYSYDIGSWHLVALNSECAYVGGCGPGSPEETWLRADLAGHPSACTLAYWHRPRFASDATGGDPTFDAFWQDLYAAHADLVLGGHDHWYERFALQAPNGQADPAGIRQLVAGTGGASFRLPTGAPLANSEKLLAGPTAFGVLRLTLHAGSYDWSFLTEGGVADAGTQTCHGGTGRGDTTPPVTTAVCRPAVACSGAWTRKVPVTVRLVATDAGAGVGMTRYTTDGSAPSAASPVYTGPLVLRHSKRVRFFSVDIVGNAEAVHEVSVSVDAAAPRVHLSWPQDGTTWARGPIRLRARASDRGTGKGAPSGVAGVRFFVDGRRVGVDHEAPYAVTWRPPDVPGAHRLKAVAVDVAGNLTRSEVIRVVVR